MTPDFLREIGEALYGPRWQSELARQVSVSDRTVRHWAAGTWSIPDGLAGELAEIIAARQQRLADLLPRLT